MQARTPYFNDAKELRDALTHPSPFLDPATGEPRKFSLLATVTLSVVEPILAAAKEYVLAVEDGLGKDPKETVPWLLG